MNLMKIEQNLTMTSREIAELIEKQHSHIKVSAERLAQRNVIATLAMREFAHNGNTYVEYLFDKRDSLVLVAQNCPEFTARIVDRWQELEQQLQPAFKIPQTMSEALILAGQQMQLAEERQVQLELAKPKVSHYDKYVESDSLKTVTNSAKEMKMTANAVWSWLRAEGHAFKSEKKNIWTKGFIEKGYGEMKQFTRKDNGHSGSQAYLTPAGDLFIKQNFTK